MAMTSQQIEQELRRKALAGQGDLVSPQNKAQFEKIKASLPGQQPKQPQDNGLGVRKYFEDAGLAGIGYDKTRNMVTVGGMDALSPTKIVNGQSFAGGDALQDAVNRVRNQQTYNKTNALLGQLETKINTPMQTPQFNYDPTSDPVYQAALNRARANAQTATGNAMAEMNRRGLLSSTIMGDRAQQIQNAEYGRVSDELVPQLFQQAYGRYRDTVGDQYTQRKDSMKDLYDLLSTTNDLGNQQYDRFVSERDYTDTKTAAEAKAKADAEAAEANAKSEAEQTRYDRLWDAAEQWGRFPDELADMLGVPKGTRTLDAEKVGISRMNAQTSRMNAGTSAKNAETSANRLAYDQDDDALAYLYEQWEKTGKAPAGIPGVLPGTPLFDQVAARQKDEPGTPAKLDAKTSVDNYDMIIDDFESYLDAGTLTKDLANRSLEANRDNLSDSDYKRLRDWIRENL